MAGEEVMSVIMSVREDCKRCGSSPIVRDELCGYCLMMDSVKEALPYFAILTIVVLLVGFKNSFMMILSATVASCVLAYLIYHMWRVQKP